MKSLWRSVLTISLAVFVLPHIASATRITPDDFDGKSMEFSGSGWKLTKYVKMDPESGIECCFARFEAGGKVIHDFRCGPVREGVNGPFDWTRVYEFKTPDKLPDLIAVEWYEGGAHSATMLRVIKLADDFPVIFDNNGSSFGYFDDLDNDGMPEIVADSFAFDYFYESAIFFGHAGSAIGTIVATYSKHWNRYMWANELFPDVLRTRVNESKEEFQKLWPDGKQIPVNIATDQHSKTADAYRALVRWAVHTAYAEGEKSAAAIIDQYADPNLAVFTKHAFRLTLQHDQNYSNMLGNRVKRE